MEEQTGNRMEMVEMVDCNGWPFWAFVHISNIVLQTKKNTVAFLE